MPRPTYADIDLDAVTHNITEIKRHTGYKKICAAVKADGYGHGAGAVARAMSNAGADMFGVAMTEEAVYLRKSGITEPIILLSTAPDDDIDQILDFDIRACITDTRFARRLSKAALRRHQKACVHVNVDTGMGRVGLHHEEAAASIAMINALPGLTIEGIFTHFACSNDYEVSSEQLKLFRRVTARLKALGIRQPLLHAANSAATLQMPESHFQCIRPGLILYGLHPPGIKKPAPDLLPALSLYSKIIFLKKVAAGTKLGYGHTFTAARDSIIATIPLGYHDGFVRQFSNCGEAIVRGVRVPVIGRVCMDQTLLDVTEVKGVAMDDEVVIYGARRNARITVEEMAMRIERIPYELTCALGERVRRRYILEGKVAGETAAGSLVPPDLLDKIFSRRAEESSKTVETGRRGAA